MTDLVPMTALGAALPRVARHGVLTISENADLGLVSIALRRGTVAPPGLPGPGQWSDGAFWTGPGQWMLEFPGRGDAAITPDAPGCSVTVQTDGWVCVEIASSDGPAPILSLMAKLVNIDVAGFGPGSATRTGMEHMSVFVIRRAEERLAVLGMRSMAASVWHTIEAAAERLA